MGELCGRLIISPPAYLKPLPQPPISHRQEPTLSRTPCSSHCPVPASAQGIFLRRSSAPAFLLLLKYAHCTWSFTPAIPSCSIYLHISPHLPEAFTPASPCHPVREAFLGIPHQPIVAVYSQYHSRFPSSPLPISPCSPL